ncbi:uncharacterized protein [Watersipora subatra]|uniref:uncharacterized protein n=1 Tax=Watersipora subatra TaxID=2589382 RepID=UPI00355C67FF
MASHGAYYYNTGKTDNKSDAGSSRRESPTPRSYADRPVTAARFGRRRSITPPPDERKVPYYQEIERPRNPGSHDERSHNMHSERPMTAQAPRANIAAPEAHEAVERANSPDPSELSEISEPEIRPNYTTVDYYTYSKCLERVISDPNLSMPVRLGIIGKWGAGKSKIMKGILWCMKQACDTNCSQLREPVDAPRNISWMHRSCGCCDMSFFAYLFCLFILLLVIIACVLLAFLLGVAPFVIAPSEDAAMIDSSNSTTLLSEGMTQQAVALIVTMSLVSFLLVIICLAGIFRWLKDRYLRGAGDMLAHFRALVIMALCDTPPPPQATTDKVEMVPICFNPSEYADSGESWSALTKLVLVQCEQAFGFWKSRLYRVSSQELQHEHDFLVADDTKWRYPGLENAAAHGHRSLASAASTHPKSARKSASSKSRTGANRAYKSSNTNSAYRKPTLKTKANKVVATGDNFGKTVNVPVHTAKWKCIGYPTLITIGIAAAVSSLLILIIISLGVKTSTAQTYHYIIIAVAASIIGLTILMTLKGTVMLLHSFCTSPEQRINALQEKYRKDKIRHISGPGYMHQVKEEIAIMVGFIRYMEHIYQRRFRILLTIEDLDKCSDERILETFNALKVLFGDDTFPVVTIVSMDAELVSRSLSKAGIESGQMYINQLLNMKFCLPDSSQYDVVKLLESQADHMLCSTSVRVNRLKETVDQKYKSADYKENRRLALHELDMQHDYEEKPKPLSLDGSHYYSHLVHGRHVSTARSKRSKSSRSKKRVIFTPLKSATTSEEGLLDGPVGSKVGNRSSTIDKAVVPPLKADQTDPAERPSEIKKDSTERPDSQLTAVRPPATKSEMRRENSALGEDSSDEEPLAEDPPWALAMTSGEARKDSSKGTVSLRRTQIPESEKTDEQLAEQHMHSVAEMKVMLGVSQSLLTALVNNPSYELSISYDSGLGTIKNAPLYVNLQALSRDEIKRNILAYGLRKRMVYLALDEVRHNIKLLDNSFARITQLFNSVYLSVYIWVQKLKQLGLVEAILDEKESDKIIVKLIKTCQELTKWVMICELWPYRASWLIYKIERVNRKMGDFPSSSFYLEASVRDIYKDIRPDMRAAKPEFELWRSYDYSDTVFKKCLERFKDLSGLSVLRYLPFTTNVDRVYKTAINQYMSARGGHNRSLQDADGHTSPKVITFAEEENAEAEQPA